MAHIRAQHIEVSFPVFDVGAKQSLFANLANRMSLGRVARSAGGGIMVNALRGVSCNIVDGERVALIGRNGSGKTTLLHTLAGMTWPASGRLEVQGKVACILNAGAGLDPNLTGIENIRFVGRLYGFNTKAQNALIEDVANFTELGAFLELPVRTYSAGMTMRLGFALATSRPRDILLVDEVVGAGDEFFLQKAKDRILRLADRVRILVMATHSPDIMRTFCKRAIWIDQGVVAMDGTPDAVWEAYVNSGRPQLVTNDGNPVAAVQ